VVNRPPAQLGNRIVHTTFLLLAVWVLATFCGCGGPDNRAEIQGTVRVNGELLASGAISFRPTEGTQGPSSGARIADGRYHVPRTMGVAVGKNLVSVVSPTLTGRKIDSGGGLMVEEGVQTIPPKYNYSSKVVSEVQPKSNQLDFDFKIDAKEWPAAAYLKTIKDK
jgi:hypothetical protein